MNLNIMTHILNIKPIKLGCVSFILIFFLSNFSFAQVNNEDDLKKTADKDFQNEEYNLAYKLYAQLVSLYPKDPEYNYRLGVCMLFVEPDKKKPFPYFKIAISNPKEAPKEAKFYLAKTYQVNYKFDDAIKLYIEYKQIGNSTSIKKLQVDREIEACKNGKRLLSNLSDLVVISKKQLNEADYFRSYDVKEIGGKLLVKPDDFKSSLDKRQKEKSVMYLPRNGERIYYSSYGESGDNGKDIYFVNKLPNGSWSKPEIMPAPINTEYDEDFPFLHPNGKTLYFSSKGHNSMGGYDIFKTNYNSQTQTWSKPINLEFPINSPDDDILFVTDSLEKLAFFSTGRYSPFGKIDVLKISTERRPMDLAFLKGTVVKETLTQSLKSKITVKNMTNGETVGTYQVQDNGEYVMDIPNGGKFLFTVETPGLPTQSEGVQIPAAYSLKPYKQIISYENKKLKISNYFDGQIADENYSVMLDLIERKAKLEINENEPYNNALKNQSDVVNENINSVSTTKPVITEDNNKPKTNTNKNVTNDQLLSIAKTDAKEASDEAQKLKQEAQDAFGLATQKTAEAVELDKKANDELAIANSIKDTDKKNSEVEKANNLKAQANVATDVANTATNMAKRLEVDANLKQKESDLTNQYISELEEITKNKNNKEALVKLEKIQKELDDLSKQKNQSDELFESLKAESVLKEVELTNSENKTKSILRDITNIKNENTSLETDLANETDKSIKENIVSQIKDLKTEIDLKNKDLETNNLKIDKLKNEVDGIKKEIEVAAKMLNEKTNNVVATQNENSNYTEGAVESNTTTTNSKPEISKITYNKLTQKYAETVNSTPINKDEINTQNSALKNYNDDIESLTIIEREALGKATNDIEKKRLTEEIKSLEKLKSDNDKTIVSNSNKIKELDSKTIVNNTINPNLNNTAVNTNSVEPTIQNETSSVNSLLREADLLSSKAIEQRKEAETKTGIENENLIKQAIENEKLSINKKTEAATFVEKNNKSTFDTNTKEIENLQKLTVGKTNENITQANKLSDDAQLFFKEAEKLRIEANSNNSDSLKLVGLKNAEGKEFEGLLKQEKSLQLLSKEAPSLKNENQPIVNSNNNIDGSGNQINTNSDTSIVDKKGNENINLPSGINQQTIKGIFSESEKLNDEAFQLRQSAVNKTPTESEIDLNKALALESEALALKVDAAEKQKIMNSEMFDLNQKKLAELQKVASGIKISELDIVDMQINEATIYFNKAKGIRQEASFYPTNSSKLGRYTSAEENENIALVKQENLLNIYAKYFLNNKLIKPIETIEPKPIVTEEEKKIEVYNQQIIKDLKTLSKVNESDYKNKLISIPRNLPPNKLELKTTAQSLYKESRDLLAQVNKTSDITKAKELMFEVNTIEKKAINLLNQITDNSSTVSNTYINEKSETNINAKTKPTSNTNFVDLKIEGFDSKNETSYNTSNPIPIDTKIEDGLIFKVQIGAFKQALPNGTFSGISPIIAQTTPSGYLRYMAGNFNKYDNALSVKNYLRNTGYKDAFVVAYFNGLRINLNEGLEKAKLQGQTISINPNITEGVASNNNITKNTDAASGNINTVNNNEPVVVTKELEKINGLLYTIQIGVFANQATGSQLFNLSPIYTEKLPNGFYRYTAGIYNNPTKLLEDKLKVIDAGIKDAFASAYYNSKRVPFTEGKKLQSDDKNVKMEAENPIIFPTRTSNLNSEISTINANTLSSISNTLAIRPLTVAPLIQPFKNGVITGPAPTPDNGVKTDDLGISYKVQIGAYKNQVPNDIAAKFLNIKTWPVNNNLVIDLYIYNIGNFTEIQFAKKLRDEAVSVGINDAFITVYKDGVKLYGNEASQYLSK